MHASSIPTKARRTALSRPKCKKRAEAMPRLSRTSHRGTGQFPALPSSVAASSAGAASSAAASSAGAASSATSSALASSAASTFSRSNLLGSRLLLGLGLLGNRLSAQLHDDHRSIIALAETQLHNAGNSPPCAIGEQALLNLLEDFANELFVVAKSCDSETTGMQVALLRPGDDFVDVRTDSPWRATRPS